MLDASPIGALSEYLDHWWAAHLSCEPADRPIAEEGIRLAYALAGLKPPQRIIWCDGPLEIANQLAAARAADVIGRNVKADVFDRLHESIGTLAEVFWIEVVLAATRLSTDERLGRAVDGCDPCSVASAEVHRVVRNAADECLSRARVRARHRLRRLRGLPPLLPRGNFDEVAIGPLDFASLGVYEYLHDVLAWREPTRSLRGLWAIARSAGWMLPHAHVCWISERPSRLSTDSRGRLHCIDGPALRYRDGWCAYAWKGVQVPAWMIEHPERITAARIGETFDPVLRDSMIEIMTPERFINSAAMVRVCEDDAGILWHTSWTYRGVTIGSWSAVEVVNATAEADGSHKRYFLRVPSRMNTAREAVAWTYGLTAEQYAQLQLRT
jgi:hypothetical protein